VAASIRARMAAKRFDESDGEVMSTGSSQIARAHPIDAIVEVCRCKGAIT
jgi:hypothetical protein